MKYTILKGWKTALPFSLRISSAYESTFIVRFTASCRYELEQERDIPEQERDINKLFGIGFFNWKQFFKGKAMHHVDSARIGWTYNKSTDRVQLWRYTYVNGHREWKPLCECIIEMDYQCSIFFGHNTYVFAAQNKSSLPFTEAVGSVRFDHQKRTWYRLNTKFGGDHSAPHTIIIHRKKV